MSELIRCPWAIKSEKEIRYHDEEWGLPCRDEQRQFEFLILEAAQAGLSWALILNKREGYRRAFAGFDPVKVAEFTPADVERLVLDPSIVRNRLKIQAAINNAQRFLEVAAQYGSFCNYFWDFVDGEPVRNAWTELAQIPATTPLSDKVSKDLKQKGFKFMGSTVVYAHLQATGLVNDHMVSCFRHKEVQCKSGKFKLHAQKL